MMRFRVLANSRFLVRSRFLKRREFLKNAALAGSGLLLPSRVLRAARAEGAPAPPQTQEEVPFGALPIRGLIEKDGKSWQPIRIPLPHESGGAEAVIRLDSEIINRQTVASGAQMLDVLIPAVASSRDANLALEISGAITEWKISLKPVRKVLVYILPHSHNDIGYTDLQANVEKKQVQNLLTGMDLARRTADYPEGARFVWNLECMWPADLFMQRMPPARKDEFRDAVKQGRVALNGMYTNTLTGLCRPEELIRLFRYATKLGDQFAVKVDSAMISDVPGFTWGTATAMWQAGIRYFSAAPNWFDRIGTLMETWQDKPFWWVSPSGKERILAWIPWTGYALSHGLKQADEKWAGDYQQRLDDINFPYDISYIRWSGHGDNAVPDPQISEFVRDWNTRYAWPKFRICSTSEAFSAFEARHGKELPEFKGDLTPYWEDGAGSSALETAMNRNSADRLVQGAALFAMSNPGGYNAQDFDDAWRNVLLYSEHTWGAWNSVSDPENKFVTDQWEGKRAYAVNADKQSRDLQSHALDSFHQRKTTDTKEAALRIFIFNTCSWPRSEILELARGPFAGRNTVPKENLLAGDWQRLSTGLLATRVDRIAPFGMARLEAARPGTVKLPQPVTATNTELNNGILHAVVDSKTGGIVEFRRAGSDENLADTSNGESLNQFLYLAGSDVANVQTNGPVKISAEEKGPLVATLRIESDAPGCNKLTRKIRLVAGADYIEITNIVDKKRAPENPNPGAGGPGGDWAQHGGKESIQFAFPFNVPNGQIQMDIPLAKMRPEFDQLPGSCKNWLPVGRWIDVSNEHGGVTWVTLDAPLVEIGEISANLLGSQHNPAVWRKHIGPTQKFYSWVMNNHWGTNYRAYQEGAVEFRYAIWPHDGYDPAAASRFAIGLSQPLVICTVFGHDLEMRPPFLRVEPDDVLVTALKPSDDGNAWIVRLFGASGEDRKAKFVWPEKPRRVWLSETNEKAIEPAGETILVPGWDLVTLRIDRTPSN
jgi:alpha-mannosidase